MQDCAKMLDLSSRKGTCPKHGIIQPLPIMENIWFHLTMDFMLRLPSIRTNQEFILVVIDKFLKMAHFITCKNTKDATLIAHLLFQKVVQLHRVPRLLLLTGM